MAANERLLVVDDEESNRDILARRLGRSGFLVDVAADGEQALRRLEEDGIDLVLLDSMMPGMSGIEVLERVRARHDRQELPIIMVTAVTDSRHIAKALDLGANDYVTKPVDFQVALARIRSQLARKRSDTALRQREERYALAARGAGDGLWDWNLRTGEVYYSPRWKAMLGFTEAEIGTAPDEWFSRVHPQDINALHRALEAHWRGSTDPFRLEYRIRAKSGTYLWMLGCGMALLSTGGKPERMAGLQTDITDRKNVDPLTRLPNRTLFADRVGEALDRLRQEPDFLFGVLFVGLDRFNLVNDSYGHAAGDRLLVEVAQRLRATIRHGSSAGLPGGEHIIARIGGDEFAVLVESLHHAPDATRVAERILAATRRPSVLPERTLFCSASIGVALCGPQYSSPEEMIRDAHTAMYAAKSLGKARCAVFDPAMRDRATTRLNIEHELQTALEKGELEVYYQPRVALATGRICGFEALLRWFHPSQGEVTPEAFIPIAEETGQISGIGLWVLRQACLQLKRWHAGFPIEPPLSVAVNVSPVQCRQPGFAAQVARVLDETGTDPSFVQLEITESVLLDNLDEARRVLDSVKRLGVRLKLDDFGTGYSCLRYLAQLPFDMLKIDRSFTLDMASPDGNSDELVRTILTMAHHLDLEVVAEGVETPEHARRLIGMGCEFGQGYLYSEPRDAAAIETMLQQFPVLGPPSGDVE